MDKEMRWKLIELARLRTTLTFSELNDELRLGLSFKYASDRKLIGEWLDEISRHEFERQRPLLSSLIVREGAYRQQGVGFYKLCESLYGKSWKKLKADLSFEVGIVSDCYLFWKNDENYRKYKTDH